MAVIAVSRVFFFYMVPKTKRTIPDRVDALVRVFWRLLRILVAFSLLPLDNLMLVISYILSHLVLPRLRAKRRRQIVLRDVHFYPKTVLISGIDTPHGLAVARCWYNEGHTVVGADVEDLPIRSGGSMSNTLLSYYRIPKSQYVSRLLDIINREKVDLWIPCSKHSTAMDDAVAKQVIESRTNCKCIHFDADLTNCFSQPNLFVQFLIERDLPVAETHQVRSRDSIHKILHRSPTKTYHMRRLNPGVNDNEVIVLPKRTPSLTYSEVSEIKISKDSPWVLQQQSRLGEFFADLLMVRGHVKAVKVRPASTEVSWGESRLDEALAIAILKLMESFAMKGGSRMTGHLSVKLMVDEEFGVDSVRHVIHIAGCTQGAAAVSSLLRDPTCAIAAGYLEVLSPQSNGVLSADSIASFETHRRARTIMSLTPRQRPSISKIAEELGLLKLPGLQLIIPILDALTIEANHYAFWKDWRFSNADPLPWWWNAHVYRPLRDLGETLNETMKRK